MPLPRKHQILRKAKSIALEQQIRAGLPTITPTEQELKETGMYGEAQVDLMRVDQEALSEQRRYLEEMAGELRLKIIPTRGLSVLKRETGYEWTNGWTKHEKRKPRPQKKKESKPKKPKRIPVIPYTSVTREVAKRKRQPKSTIPQIVQKHRKAWDKKVFEMIEGKPKPKPKKRKNRHIERSGKTMRVLRKIDGVKVFSFPDSVWKVRKPRKRRKKK